MQGPHQRLFHQGIAEIEALEVVFQQPQLRLRLQGPQLEAVPFGNSWRRVRGPMKAQTLRWCGKLQRCDSFKRLPAKKPGSRCQRSRTPMWLNVGRRSLLAPSEIRKPAQRPTQYRRPVVVVVAEGSCLSAQHPFPQVVRLGAGAAAETVAVEALEELGAVAEGDGTDFHPGRKQGAIAAGLQHRPVSIGIEVKLRAAADAVACCRCGCCC